MGVLQITILRLFFSLPVLRSRGGTRPEGDSPDSDLPLPEEKWLLEQNTSLGTGDMVITTRSPGPHAPAGPIFFFTANFPPMSFVLLGSTFSVIYHMGVSNRPVRLEACGKRTGLLLPANQNNKNYMHVEKQEGFWVCVWGQAKGKRFGLGAIVPDQFASQKSSLVAMVIHGFKRIN